MATMSVTTNVVSLPIDGLGGSIIVLSRARRLYVAASRDLSYFHVIRPARPTDQRVVEGRAQVGDLICDCIGSATHGRCYQQMNAEAIERADASGITRPAELGPDPDPRAALDAGSASFDAPVGAGEMVEASRG